MANELLVYRCMLCGERREESEVNTGYGYRSAWVEDFIGRLQDKIDSRTLIEDELLRDLISAELPSEDDLFFCSECNAWTLYDTSYIYECDECSEEYESESEAEECCSDDHHVCEKCGTRWSDEEDAIECCRGFLERWQCASCGAERFGFDSAKNCCGSIPIFVALCKVCGVNYTSVHEATKCYESHKFYSRLEEEKKLNASCAICASDMCCPVHKAHKSPHKMCSF